MSYRLVEESTIKVPGYHTKRITVHKTDGDVQIDVSDASSPTGATKEVTHKLWRCESCKAMACGDSAPSECGNAKCPLPAY